MCRQSYLFDIFHSFFGKFWGSTKKAVFQKKKNLTRPGFLSQFEKIAFPFLEGCLFTPSKNGF